MTVAPAHQRRRFRILETLGKGGFGTVYRAEMTDAGGFSKQVALKVLTYEGAQLDEIARRLRDEARLLGMIRHRAVVGVNSLVPLQDGWGVVMEYIAGIDLSTAIKHARPQAGVSLEIVEEVAAALDAAYNRSKGPDGSALHLIHRDIKPGNIRITRQGEVKLLDFGVATAELGTLEGRDQRGLLIGSSRYVAPERHDGVETHAADVFALGVVLANLLTGKRFKDPPRDAARHSNWLGTVLQTVQKKMQTADDPEVRAAAAQVRLLLLEMLAFDRHDRPDAHRVELRCRKIRKSLPPPWMRDWAERTVPRLSEGSAVGDDEPDSGLVFDELLSEVIDEPGDSLPGARELGGRRRQLELVAAAAVGFLAGCAATLALGGG